ncbi:formate dehydrogenase [Sinirhodobacter ferrireducens]|uniref:Formate dehydrogenase n=1 Tax=Paenirhodobacter ferrireducens TaxID=1215032 RepID=A0A443LQE0_9RHOB|nr:formate dehydrogenase subunit delta [Sinirhodobacter ferrireducens]RWR51382.1 formate dehydrogenase [Sinirhodobacter ferrireducens]
MSEDRLIRMANQIATFFEVQPGDGAAAVAAHLNENWSVPMRAGLAAQIAAGAGGVHPLVAAALPLIRTARVSVAG